MQKYLTVAVILTFVVNCVLILGTNRLFACPMQPARAVIAASLIGVYACACLLRPALGKPAVRIACMLAEGALAFGVSFGGVRRICVFLLLQAAVGGVAELLDAGGTLGVLAACAAVGGLCLLGFAQGRAGNRQVPIELEYGGRRVRLTALRDTGNTLTDPLTGERVLVIGAEAACALTGLTKAQLQKPLDTLEHTALRGLRLIPYRAVGTQSGMLLAMRMQCSSAAGRERVIVAFAPEGIEAGSGYDALAGGAL